MDSKSSTMSTSTMEQLSNVEFSKLISQLTISKLPSELIRLIFSNLLEKDPLSIFDFDLFMFQLGEYEPEEEIALIIECLKRSHKQTKTPLFSNKKKTKNQSFYGMDRNDFTTNKIYTKLNFFNILNKIKPHLTDFSFIFDKQSFQSVIETENLEIFEWLYSVGCPFDSHCTTRALDLQDFESFVWLCSKGCPLNFSSCYEIACEHGDFTSLKYIRSQDKEKSIIPYTCLNYAIRKGNLKMVKWLKTNHCEWNKSHLEVAAYQGNCLIVEWMFRKCETPFPLVFENVSFVGEEDEDKDEEYGPMEIAIDRDDEDFITLLSEVGYPLHESHVNHALKKGNFRLANLMIKELKFPFSRGDQISVCNFEIKKYRNYLKYVLEGEIEESENEVDKE